MFCDNLTTGEKAGLHRELCKERSRWSVTEVGEIRILKAKREPRFLVVARRGCLLAEAARGASFNSDTMWQQREIAGPPWFLSAGGIYQNLGGSHGPST